MKPSRIILTTAALLVAAGAGAAVGATYSQEPQDAAAAMPKPGPEHEIMKQDVGTWSAAVKHWPAPGMEPIEMTGTETNNLDCNGLWMLTHFQTADGSFTGRGISGWDAAKKRYVSAWVDSMSMSLALSQGTYDKAKKTLTLNGEQHDPGSGKMLKNRQLAEYPDANTRKLTVWTTPATGAEFKSLEITYTKSK